MLVRMLLDYVGGAPWFWRKLYRRRNARDANGIYLKVFSVGKSVRVVLSIFLVLSDEGI
jgi:hypothetical protein